MKITLAYIPEEGQDREAAAMLEDLRRRYPTAKVRISDRHPPFRHIYLTVKKPEKPLFSPRKAIEKT